MIYPKLEIDGKNVSPHELDKLKLTEEELSELDRWACDLHQICLEKHLQMPERRIDWLCFGGNTRKVDMSPTPEFFVGKADELIYFSLRARWILCRHNRGKKPIGYEEAIRRSENPWCLDYWLARLAVR